MKRRRPEDEIQRAVFQHLKARAAKKVFYFHPFNGGYRRPIEAAITKGLGVRAGVPDIIAIRAGQVFGLELKANGGKVSASQIEVQDLMQCAGAVTATAYGLDGALRWLEQHGILQGRAQ